MWLLWTISGKHLWKPRMKACFAPARFDNFSLKALLVYNLLTLPAALSNYWCATDQSDVIINFLDQSCHIQCVIWCQIENKSEEADSLLQSSRTAWTEYIHGARFGQFSHFVTLGFVHLHWKWYCNDFIRVIYTYYLFFVLHTKPESV